MPQSPRTRAQALQLADDDASPTAPSSTTSSPPPSPTPSSAISTLTSLDSREFDDTSIANADSYHQAEKPRKRRRRAPEDVELRKHALEFDNDGEEVRGNSGQLIFTCRRCKQRCSSHTHFRNHLKNHHGTIVATAAKQPHVVKEASTLMAALRVQQLKAEARKAHQIDTEAWLNTLILMVVNHNLPHTLLEWPEFHLLMKLTNPQIVEKDGPLRSSRYSIKQLLFSAYEKHKKTIIEKLRLATSKLHFTTDIWTSPNKSYYQAITCHFIDKSSRLVKLTLALRAHTTEGHGADEQSVVFLNVLKEYEISKEKIGYLTGDNHGSNDKLCQLLADTFTGWDPVQHRIRCMGHVLNLACQAFLFAKNAEATEIAIRDAEALSARDESLPNEDEYSQDEGTQERWRAIGAMGKIHNIAVWLRRSPARYQRFKQQAGRTLPRDNDTRWNSWYTMLEAAVGLEHHIRVFTEIHRAEIGKNQLSVDEWQTLVEMRDILKPFKEVTDELQKDEANLDEVLWAMDFLIRHISAKVEDFKGTPEVSAKLLAMWFTFDKYYNLTDATPAYISALILNPLRRRQYITNNWQLIEEKHPGISEKAISAARGLWRCEYRDREGPGDQLDAQIELDAIENTVLRQRKLEEISRRLGGDEFESFINGPQDVQIAGTALEWWLEPTQRKNYPRLSQMAIDVLSIPPMSAESERVFSGARRTITWERHSLGADVVEKTECIKSWIKVLMLEQVV